MPKTAIFLDPSKTPKEIEERSFAIIESEVPIPRRYTGLLWEVARRCIHAAGDISLLADLELSLDALKSGLWALNLGCTIYTDTRMCAAGLAPSRYQPLNVSVKSIMDLPNLEEYAVDKKITRARAGIELIAEHLASSIVVIGNAPTALLSLLEILDQGASPPALIIGMPVGFVNASQAKELLHNSSYPHFTLLGRKGGSAIAAAAINALALIALRGNVGV